eukprot:gene19876-39420_t
MSPMTAALHTPTAPTTLTITRPDDWHLHVRDGEPLHTVVPHTAAQFGRAIIMPNLRPPVTTAEQALAYKQRILAAVPAGVQFEPLMTLYLTDNLPPEEIVRAKAAGVVACKLYPAGATTNSDAGVTDLRKIYPVLEAMQREGLLLLVHGEVISSDIDLFDRFTRTDLKSILIIGAGPIIIGQACEFDYSGVQACKALREEGYKVILINSNPATIMTDPATADVTYIEPITWQVVERIIEKERPDAVLPTMGGQTALNCALDLAKHGVLAKYNVELIGAKEEAIEKAEDRLKFKNAMTSIGLDSAKSGVAHSMEEALEVQARIAKEVGSNGFPVIIRPSFTLG